MAVVDNFNKHSIRTLEISAFEKLPLKTKFLTYHLAKAGMNGRDIFYDQNNRYNIEMKDFLENLYYIYPENLKNDDKSTYNNFLNYLKTFWFHCGIHHGTSFEKNKSDFTESELRNILNNLDQPTSRLFYRRHHVELIFKIIFDDSYESFSISQDKNKDLILDSSNNFYAHNLTRKDVEDYYKNTYPEIDNSPQFGFNSTLYKDDNGNIKEDVWFINGLYGESIKHIVSELEMALNYTENEKQFNSISTLIEFYKSGKPEDFDKHSLAWIEDTDSKVYFLNGFIECYADPKGIHSTYESLVAIKDEKKSERISLLSDNAQWFEDRLPINKKFKKKEAKGLTASASIVIGMAGDTSPSVPLGICLPNSDWIREKHGSKSVVLSNVGGGSSAADENELNEFLYTKELVQNAIKYNGTTNALHTDLHEVLGHGSGRSLDGVCNDDLDDYYSIIEEARADLVGLFYIYDEKLIEFGLIENTDASKAQYQHYIMNGLIYQLKRVELGKTLTQTHMRNRQLISSWVFEKGLKDKVIEKIIENNKTFFIINDHTKLRELFGDLLDEIQRIKSEGDYESAKLLIDNYATNINYAIHKETLDRYNNIDYSAFTGFIVPIIEPVFESNTIVDFNISNHDSFIDNQLYQSEFFSYLK
jgi:dipeptidyl-peptidase-3